MPRIGDIGRQYFDGNGDPLGGGKLFFYESGTTTPKNTYANQTETVLNPNPVILDAEGRQPDVFFTGQAKVILRNVDDVQIEEREHIGIAPHTHPESGGGTTGENVVGTGSGSPTPGGDGSGGGGTPTTWGNWTVDVMGEKLLFIHNGMVRASLTETGVFTANDFVKGTP